MNYSVWIFFLCIFFPPASILAQPTFSRTYDLVGMQGSDRGASVQAIGDDFVIGVGSLCNGYYNACTGLIKTNNAGDVLWQFYYDQFTEDIYPNWKDDFFLRGDTLFFASEMRKGPEADWQYYLAKASWQNSGLYSLADFGSAEGDYATSLEPLPDNRWMLFGFGWRQGKWKPVLNVVQNDSIIEASYYLDFPYSAGENDGMLEPLPDGDYITAVQTKTPVLPFTGLAVSKVDSLGNIIWSRHFNDSLSIGCRRRITPLQNGGFAVVNCTDTAYNISPYSSWAADKVIGLDSVGNTAWEYFFHAPSWKRIHNITLAQNGDILGCGIDNSYPDGQGGVRLSGFVFRMSPEGQLLWERRFINDATHLYADILLLDDICEAPDGRIAVVGLQSNLFPNGTPNGDAWLLVLDENGCLEPGCTERDYVISGQEEPVQQPAAANPAWFHLYPQPAGDWLTVNFDRDLPPRCRLLLHSALGRLEMEQPLTAGQQQATLDTSGLPAGLYVLALATQDGQLLHTQKVFVNNK